MQPKWSEPISSLSALNGWRRPLIAAGDSADARICRFLFMSNVFHGWPSKDRIVFTNGETFWISSQKIRGKRVSLFAASEEIVHRYRRQQAEDQIRCYFEKAAPAERDSLTDLVFRTARPKVGRLCGRGPVVILEQCLPELSLVDVEDIAALVRWPAAA